ncbi:ArsC family reductase [Acerihabitans arboris]|uniref:ArsC family reductase n=1 Tax=Acerihabitans arboris TaxID=2691583 RepID=A0A845SRB5_9GAMM|nr:ArsC family reductase [Acerihabitans arboris]NDL65416.1 ArsC family reductase [Acerihabitans arboris]
MHDPEVGFTLYGIKNCDTIKKARRWLDERQVNYRFHDYRADGVDDALLRRFTDGVGWQTLLNTRGTTWRKLSDGERRAADGAEGALALMVNQPAIIKRPVLQAADGRLLVGFDAAGYQHFIHEES